VLRAVSLSLGINPACSVHGEAAREEHLSGSAFFFDFGQGIAFSGGKAVSPVTVKTDRFGLKPLKFLFYQEFEQRLLAMEAVFSLIKDSTVRAVHDLVGDLFAAMGRKAVQYNDILF